MEYVDRPVLALAVAILERGDRKFVSTVAVQVTNVCDIDPEEN